MIHLVPASDRGFLKAHSLDANGYSWRLARETRLNGATGLMVWREGMYPNFEDGLFAWHLYRYVWALPYAYNKNVLDAGCGSGYGAELLSLVAKNVTAIDYNSDIVAENSGKYASRVNLEFEVMDLTSLKLPVDRFDLIVCFEVYEHIAPSQCDTVLRDLHRTCKRQGKALFSTPNRLVEAPYMKSAALTNPYHINSVAPNEFRASLRRHFTHVQLFGQKPKEKMVKRLLKTLDVLNLRHYVFSYQTKRRLDLVLSGGVPSFLPDMSTIEISKSLVRQSSVLLARCTK